MIYYVSTNGNDNALGTKEAPFKTINHAAKVRCFTADTSSSTKEELTLRFSRKVSSTYTFTKSTYKPMKW